MEKKIKEAFKQVTISQGCINRIEQAMHTQSKDQSVRWSCTWRVASVVASVLLLFVILLAGNLDVVHALENVVEEVVSAVTSGKTVTSGEKKYSFLDGILQVETNVDSNGKHSSEASFIQSRPGFLSERDGRLYFTANEENIDITDLISMEEPFLYSYTDAYMFTHYYAVGISVPDAETILEQAGWSYWVQDAEAAKESHSGGWISGCSAGHYNNRLEIVLPWHKKAIEVFNVPWSI